MPLEEDWSGFAMSMCLAIQILMKYTNRFVFLCFENLKTYSLCFGTTIVS